MSTVRDTVPAGDLFSLVSADTTLSRKCKNEFAGPCPQCGGEDRFVVNAVEGWWFCRQCAPQRGDAPGYLQWRDGLTYKQALEKLGETEVLALPVQGQKDLSPTLRAAFTVIADRCFDALHEDRSHKPAAWLAGRGITAPLIEQCVLGYSPPNQDGMNVMADCRVPCGIAIPLWGVDGLLYGVQVRRSKEPANWAGSRDWRYQTVEGSIVPLYGQPTAHRHGVTVLVEGCFDAMLLHRVAGDLVDVAALGSARNGVDDRWLGYLSDHTVWLIALDADDAGRKGAQGWIDWSERARIAAQPSGCKDASEYWQLMATWGGADEADSALRAWVKQQVEGKAG